jgi:hypothetical protein
MDDMLLGQEEVNVPLPGGIWRYYLNKKVGERQDSQWPKYRLNIRFGYGWKNHGNAVFVGVLG